MPYVAHGTPAEGTQISSIPAGRISKKAPVCLCFALAIRVLLTFLNVFVILCFALAVRVLLTCLYVFVLSLFPVFFSVPYLTRGAMQAGQARG